MGGISQERQEKDPLDKAVKVCDNQSAITYGESLGVGPPERESSGTTFFSLFADSLIRVWESV